MKQVNIRSRSPLVRASLAVLFLGATLAGCITAPEGPEGAPEAVLGVQGDRHWAGSPVAFDVAESQDVNGRIESYRIDFGDGNVEEFTDEQLEQIEHTYEEGGIYEVVLTIQDDGEDQEGPLNATDRKTVNVLESIAVESGLLVATPEGTDGAQRHNMSFPVRDNATGIEADLGVESTLLVGTSEVVVRLLNGTGAVLVEENVTADAGGTERAHLFSPIEAAGDYALEVVANSGAVRANGTLTIYYGTIPTVPPEPEEGTEGDNETGPREHR